MKIRIFVYDTVRPTLKTLCISAIDSKLNVIISEEDEEIILILESSDESRLENYVTENFEDIFGTRMSTDDKDTWRELIIED